MDVTILIFGATGDLAKKKLIPALYGLIKTKKLENYIIVGAAINDISVHEVLDHAKSSIADLDENLWKSLSQRFFYKPIDFNDKNYFDTLKNYVEQLEKQFNLVGNRLIYCATPSDFFCVLTEHVAQSGLAKRTTSSGPWCRIIYEKPFGHDLQSAQEINACIARYFDEDQIYRIDHFLTKELVINLALLRFTNIVFEPLWNNQFIDNIQIIIDEKILVDDRGKYYDRYGAVRDIVQNHQLELLALIAMEAPKKLEGNYIREERARVLQHVRFVDGIFGQYQGYLTTHGVQPQSTTETWAELICTIDNERWNGVPFYLRTGKGMRSKCTIIHVVFKQAECRLTTCPVANNYLTIRIDPDAGFTLYLNAKKPGELADIMPVAMDFCHSCLYAQTTPRAYEVLLEEVLRGSKSIAVRFDEIEDSWRMVDEIYARKLPVFSYVVGSEGPQERMEFAKKHGIRVMT